MTYGEKKQLLYHYILRDNRENENSISPSRMYEVNNDMYSVEESVLLHPSLTVDTLFKGEKGLAGNGMEMAFGNKLLRLNSYMHDGEYIGKACYSKVTGRIYFSVEG